MLATTSTPKHLSAKQVNQRIPFSLATIRRLSKDTESDFPKPFTVGRSIYWKESNILQYLSKKAGFTVETDDRAITAKELQDTFDKSYTWLWQNIKLGNIPKPFYINRSRFWMQSQINDLMETSKGEV